MQIEKLLPLISLLRPAVGGALARRAIAPIVTLVALAMLAGMLGMMVLSIALMAVHHGFLAQGFSPAEALSYTALVALLLLLITVFAMLRILRQARNALRPRASIDVVQAFLDGFNQTPRN